MRRRQRVERIDRHMERADRLLVDIQEEIRLTREEVTLSREERSDTRAFTRDLMLRMERVTDAHERRMLDLHQESVAQREALIRILDRLDQLGPGGSAATA